MRLPSLYTTGDTRTWSVSATYSTANQEHPDEAVVIALFETNADRLAAGDTPGERLYNSLVECMRGASRATARDLGEFLVTSRFPGYNPNSLEFFRASVPQIELIRQIVNPLPSHQRASIYQALNSWKLLGSEHDLWKALEECLQDPEAFSDESQLLAAPWSPTSLLRGLPEKYDFYRIDPNRWVDIVVGARNARVQELFLESTQGVPATEARQRALANLLLDSDEDKRYYVARHFATRYKDEQHRPEMRWNKGRREYPNLSEYVAFWKQRFGL
ncbi:MAG: hypothetical protein WAO58_08160 [Fimbriimonadaceae bacterium]